MRVTIGDLDYYYAKDRVNKFNPDVMKISSYHKQLGDCVNFVQTEFDIRRAFDLYYIIKENDKTPNPPLDFFTNSKVRGWGKAFIMRVNGKMSDAMLSCRPDYLLYPEKNTKLERAEQVRFFNNNAEPLKLVQNWSNSFKNKKVIVVDKYMGACKDSKSIIGALKQLQDIKNVVFFEPIGIQKLLSDKEIRDEFLKIKFSPGTNFNWGRVKTKDVGQALDFLQELKQLNKNVAIGDIVYDYGDADRSHGESKQNALDDFETIRKVICIAQDKNIKIKIKMPKTRFETPYFELFEALSEGTSKAFNISGLEFITKKYTGVLVNEGYGNTPTKGHPVFRDLLMQTYMFDDFIRHRANGLSISSNLMPGKLGKKEFEYGI